VLNIFLYGLQVSRSNMYNHARYMDFSPIHHWVLTTSLDIISEKTRTTVSFLLFIYFRL
jgi:hypothetical protein